MWEERPACRGSRASDTGPRRPSRRAGGSFLTYTMPKSPRPAPGARTPHVPRVPGLETAFRVGADSADLAGFEALVPDKRGSRMVHPGQQVGQDGRRLGFVHPGHDDGSGLVDFGGFVRQVVAIVKVVAPRRHAVLAELPEAIERAMDLAARRQFVVPEPGRVPVRVAEGQGRRVGPVGGVVPLPVLVAEGDEAGHLGFGVVEDAEAGVVAMRMSGPAEAPGFAQIAAPPPVTILLDGVPLIRSGSGASATGQYTYDDASGILTLTYAHSRPRLIEVRW
jgi:hypothetical protein